jgi:hypothetical protein
VELEDSRERSFPFEYIPNEMVCTPSLTNAIPAGPSWLLSRQQRRLQDMFWGLDYFPAEMAFVNDGIETISVGRTSIRICAQGFHYYGQDGEERDGFRSIQKTGPKKVLFWIDLNPACCYQGGCNERCVNMIALPQYVPPQKESWLPISKPLVCPG